MNRLLQSVFVVLSSSAISLFSLVSSASPLTYQPTNPSFGGNPFNSSHLIGLANEQKSFTSARTSIPSRDPLDDFSRTIQRSLLSRLSQDIADSILGENAQDSGSFLIGDTQIFFANDGTNVSIDLTDLTTGGTTNIILPATAGQ
ncbi:MAG: curli assembly protein CsgF [Rickettsiales bacterium]|nr:hypothetical protein [Pseudomonadota bacterium]MDA0965626.1 hypothetical protein [Pseudomonadota bacterium]MDG4542950.1 curli assembly protein CsgF [Rickettsiales bacterium]MDG4544602.1 curli assembly protein CsgF [Rickettsiales bacterium]MDG4546724.1 curli assembly protein CsgF [Rickettsiales bacterium]